MSESLRADLARLHAALNTLDVPDRGDETDRFNHGQRWMLDKVRHALRCIHDSGVSPGASTWYRVDNGWRQDGWPGGSMFVEDGVMPGWGPEGPGSPLAPDMVVGKAGVPIDAYDAIELLSRRPDHPSRLLAEKARAVADWANDPLPHGSHTRDRIAEIAPELVDALYELLGGGPGDVSDARPADGSLAEYWHDDCATCGTKADPVILQHPAGYTLAEQVQAVWDEEGADGVADAIRQVARGEGT